MGFRYHTATSIATCFATTMLLKTHPPALNRGDERFGRQQQHNGICLSLQHSKRVRLRGATDYEKIRRSNRNIHYCLCFSLFSCFFIAFVDRNCTTNVVQCTTSISAIHTISVALFHIMLNDAGFVAQCTTFVVHCTTNVVHCAVSIPVIARSISHSGCRTLV